MMTLAIYAEHTARAGERAYEPRNYAGENWPHDDDDVLVYEGTDSQLRAFAAQIKRDAPEGPSGSYKRKVAGTILGAVRKLATKTFRSDKLGRVTIPD